MAEEFEGIRDKVLKCITIVNVKTVFGTIFLNCRSIRILEYKLLI